jgi:hypothetical protein
MTGYSFPAEERFFCSPPHPHRLWGHPIGTADKAARLITGLRLVERCRMRGTSFPGPYTLTSSWGVLNIAQTLQYVSVNLQIRYSWGQEKFQFFCRSHEASTIITLHHRLLFFNLKTFNAHCGLRPQILSDKCRQDAITFPIHPTEVRTAYQIRWAPSVIPV